MKDRELAGTYKGVCVKSSSAIEINIRNLFDAILENSSEWGSDVREEEVGHIFV